MADDLFTADELDVGYRLEQFAEQSEVTEADVLELWQREDVIPDEEAEKRVHEVHLVALHEDDGLVGLSSAYLRRNQQLNLDLWYYRAFVSSAHRKSNVAVNLATSGRDLLQERYVSGQDVRGQGIIYVVENVGTTGQPGVVSVNPATGAQALVTQGGSLCYPFGIAAQASGSLLVTDYGDFSDGTTVINCTHDFGALVRVDPGAKSQVILSRNAAQWGNLFRNPLGVTVEPGGRILLVNQNGGTALVAVDPGTGVQDAETTNTATDRNGYLHFSALRGNIQRASYAFKVNPAESGAGLTENRRYASSVRITGTAAAEKVVERAKGDRSGALVKETDFGQAK